jgi:hypothetical protein
MRGLDRARLLDAAEHGAECRRGDSASGLVAGPKEDVALEPAGNLVPLRGAAKREEFGKPLARYGFEAARLSASADAALRKRPFAEG